MRPPRTGRWSASWKPRASRVSRRSPSPRSPTSSPKSVKHWYRRGAVAWLLWPASLAFAVVVSVRRFLYWIRLFKSEHPGIPVIVVGNLVAGGSGKTPLVLWIAEFLKSKGWRPAIVSRGYGSTARGAMGTARGAVGTARGAVGTAPSTAGAGADRPRAATI